MNKGDKIDNKDRKLVFVCKHGELKDGKCIKVMLNEEIEAALFYVKGNYYALNNECPHNHLRKIDKGFIHGHTVSCPMHGWTYSLFTGENVKSGASLDSYPVEIIDGNVFIAEPEAKRPKWMDSF